MPSPVCYLTRFCWDLLSGNTLLPILGNKFTKRGIAEAMSSLQTIFRFHNTMCGAVGEGYQPYCV